MQDICGNCGTDLTYFPVRFTYNENNLHNVCDTCSGVQRDAENLPWSKEEQALGEKRTTSKLTGKPITLYWEDRKP